MSDDVAFPIYNKMTGQKAPTVNMVAHVYNAYITKMMETPLWLRGAPTPTARRTKPSYRQRQRAHRLRQTGRARAL